MVSTPAQLRASREHKARRMAEGFRPVVVWLSADDLAWIAGRPQSREAVMRDALAGYMSPVDSISVRVMKIDVPAKPKPAQRSETAVAFDTRAVLARHCQLCGVQEGMICENPDECPHIAQPAFNPQRRVEGPT